jgi:Spy/CpxP family protein refolding chaperone
MKKLSLLLLILSFGFFVANAQQVASANAEQRANAMTERMHKEANFSPEQKTQVYAINLEAAQKMIAVQQDKQNGVIDANTAKQRRKEINMDRESRIVALLTPEQRAKYEARKQKRMNNSIEDAERIAPRRIPVPAR